MGSLLKLLILYSCLSFSNPLSLLPLPRIDGVLPIANISEVEAANISNLTAKPNWRFIDAVKEAYTVVTERYKHAYFVGIRAIKNDAGEWTSIRVVFTNIASHNDRGIVVSMGPDGQWLTPSISHKDYGVGNKYMFRSALALDIKDVDMMLRKRYPRAEYEIVFLYHPKQVYGFSDQPYWIFMMKRSISWEKYSWVGIYDWKVTSSSEIPESVTHYSETTIVS